MRWLCLRLSISCFIFLTIWPQDTEGVNCASAKTCSDCMKQSPDCAWCKSTAVFSNKCDAAESLLAKGCEPDQIVQPKSSLDIVENATLSNAGDAALGDAVQLKPQKIQLKLRPGDKYRVKLDVRQAEDYPLDLYYVMDVSSSMADDLQSVGRLGNDLATRMSNITRDFRLGFGAFVDKVVMPYVDLSKLDDPCVGTDLDFTCQPPFSFQNALSLTNETSKFSDVVSNLQPSGSLDYPEGGLDALMQAATCKDIIGWRERARHLLFYTSDAPFHIAGDGKLGGVVKANDGKCHTSASTGYYTMYDQLDYPSVSQLSQVLEQNSILPVFAVTDKIYNVYEKLPAFFHEAEVTEIKEDSSNVVDVITDIYSSITSKIEMDDSITGELKDLISLQYTSICVDGTTTANNKECAKLALGDTISFLLDITVNKSLCDKDVKSRSFKVGPLSFVEKLEVLVEAICDCDCEQIKELDSPKCTNGNGTFVCGGCVCNEGRSGAYCECDQDETEEGIIDPQCLMEVEDEVVCSGQGQCKCSVCLCRETTPPRIISGDFCECDTNDCLDAGSNEICAGAGQCICHQNDRSRCLCMDGYTGEFCTCSSSNFSCIARNGLVCGGRGYCECNQCKCDEGYDGQACECKNGECESECDANKPCVKCHFKEGELYENGLCEETCLTEPIIVDDLEDIGTAQKCKYKDENQCVVSFTQEILPNEKLELTIKRDPDCYGGPGVLWIIIGIIIGIILVGLALLLIWRLLTFIHDRREFEQFEKERQDAKWEGGHNPLYKPSTSTFKNPTYSAKQNS
ncbi:integrin beta-1-B-like [Antedon mediterranea]|uniref:integrin beta-1-B-like n=1 Tax=Antedon mediterranea TaxID=105859 RepID=UPI003AF412D0